MFEEMIVLVQWSMLDLQSSTHAECQHACDDDGGGGGSFVRPLMTAACLIFKTDEDVKR
jgi:hypothetical protein